MYYLQSADKECIRCGINGLANHLVFHGISDSTRTERENEDNNADIMMQQLNDKSAKNDCAMENKKRQRSCYESIQDQPIMQTNTLKQILRSETSNNESLAPDVLTSQNVSKCLKLDEEIGRNIVDLRRMQHTNEPNIASSRIYREAYLPDTASEGDRWLHYGAVQNQRTVMTNVPQQILQTHNATNVEVCPMDYLAYSTNRYSKSDEETRRTANMTMQFSVNRRNNTGFYQEVSHLPVIGSERSQWLYYKAIKDLETFMLTSSK
ncbi:uncharacterized protein LOC105430301 [Pogonomyrmex barbatus]|uniref:Uncharacterized protein LOC105430301 n=1 Tax=Pogonomyrmex barbatus TaxID=144034 RepID=A0A6I9WR41_9HYME|nr:uncharacterized protein LOC105430301 [Pogonomyrmex barbatus]